MSFVPAVQVASDSLPRNPNVHLEHLPGPNGHWYFGNLRALLPDPAAFLIEMRARYGDCFTVGVLFNRRVVVLAGPAANRLVLLDPESNFSSRMGWEVMLDFFGGFLMLRDFEDHRMHRRLMTGFFKPAALRRYLDAMLPIIRNATPGFDGQPDAYRLARRLALDIGLQVFAGFAPTPRNEPVYLDTQRILDGVMFGKGSHMCIGINFAMLAVKALFTHLLRAFDIRLAAERTPVIGYLPTLRPVERLRLSFVPNAQTKGGAWPLGPEVSFSLRGGGAP